MARLAWQTFTRPGLCDVFNGTQQLFGIAVGQYLGQIGSDCFVAAQQLGRIKRKQLLFHSHTPERVHGALDGIPGAGRNALAASSAVGAGRFLTGYTCLLKHSGTRKAA